jgi:hypothetical protein
MFRLGSQLAWHTYQLKLQLTLRAKDDRLEECELQQQRRASAALLPCAPIRLLGMHILRSTEQLGCDNCMAAINKRLLSRRSRTSTRTTRVKINKVLIVRKW